MIGTRNRKVSQRPTMTTTTPKILVADDTLANRVAMRRLLARSGAELYEAASGNEALALCLEHEFALILLDVNMPGMDGFEVAALLSEADQMKDTPIIFVTAAYVDDVNRLKGYRHGAVDYIAKPVNDLVLQSKVRVFLELYAARVKLEQTLEELSERNDQLQLEIAERERVEAQVRHQATHDMLTGLPNRTLFHDRLDTAMRRAVEGGSGFALVLLDIDGFKGVNDRHGHPAGDTLLQAIAARLKLNLRTDDTVARLGGDEFALIIGKLEDVPVLMKRCHELGTSLAEPYPLVSAQGSFVANVSASIGIALWSPETDGDEALIQAADHALYRAKEGGKNCCVLAT